jgi:cephalosporin-C deacetylase
MLKSSYRSFVLWLWIAVCAAGAVVQAAAPKAETRLSVRAARSSAIYKQGETVIFQVQLPTDSPLARDAELAWKISKDGVAPVQTGKVKLVDGKAEITGKLDEPGHLLCSVTGTAASSAITALGGAAIDPLQIKPSLPVPEDFDAFWSEQKQKLVAVPMNSRLTPVRSKAATNAECFDVQADCAGGAPMCGYYARPAGAKPKSLPAILLVQGAGVNSSSLPNALAWSARGFLAMDINAHGIANGKPAQFYKDLEQGALNKYSHFGRESRETCYFLGMFLRAIRAIDFLTAQPEWDGKTVVVYGSSQGGFQAFAAGGLDERVSFIAAGVPAGCDHTGVVVGRINGWPKLVTEGPDGKPEAKLLQAARYFDNVNFAARTKAKGAFVTVGFIDQTCPVTSVYAAYNNLRIPKRIYNDIPTGHANSPAATQARNRAVLDYVKSVK